MKYKMLFLLFFLVSCGDSVINPDLDEGNVDNSLNRHTFTTNVEYGCWEPSANNCGPGDAGFPDLDYYSDCIQCGCVWYPNIPQCENGGSGCIYLCGETDCVENDKSLTLCEYEVVCADPYCSNYDTSCDEYPKSLGTCVTAPVGGQCEDCFYPKKLKIGD